MSPHGVEPPSEVEDNASYRWTDNQVGRVPTPQTPPCITSTAYHWGQGFQHAAVIDTVNVAGNSRMVKKVAHKPFKGELWLTK